MGVWGVFFLKLFILLAGVYVLILLTPKLAKFIDSHRKSAEEGQPPEEPRPERVEDKDDKK